MEPPGPLPGRLFPVPLLLPNGVRRLKSPVFQHVWGDPFPHRSGPRTTILGAASGLLASRLLMFWAGWFFVVAPGAGWGAVLFPVGGSAASISTTSQKPPSPAADSHKLVQTLQMLSGRQACPPLRPENQRVHWSPHPSLQCVLPQQPEDPFTILVLCVLCSEPAGASISMRMEPQVLPALRSSLTSAALLSGRPAHRAHGSLRQPSLCLESSLPS